MKRRRVAWMAGIALAVCWSGGELPAKQMMTPRISVISVSKWDVQQNPAWAETGTSTGTPPTAARNKGLRSRH